MTNQRDYIVENLSGSGVRTELNNILGDIQTNNSGSSEPTTTVAYKTWVDTTNNKLKIRNSSNNGWITLGSISENLGLARTEDPLFTGKYIRIPSGNTGARPSSPNEGDTRFNTTTKLLEFFAGTSWSTNGAKLDVFSFTAVGANQTFTPEEGRTFFLVICTGGGGGASGVTVHGSPANYWGAPGGGSAGTAIRGYTKAELGTSASVVVGNGGSAGVAGGGFGGNGGSSSFAPQNSSSSTLSATAGSTSLPAYDSSAAASDMGRPGNRGFATGGNLNLAGDKAEFQTINNYTGTTASGIDIVDMQSSGGSSFWGKGAGSGADGNWSNVNAAGSAGADGVVVVLSW
tara:strand:+ start:36 stop:1070 length:1035 start_codon:yes stop_codon:yes gene_type:complete